MHVCAVYCGPGVSAQPMCTWQAAWCNALQVGCWCSLQLGVCALLLCMHVCVCTCVALHLAYVSYDMRRIASAPYCTIRTVLYYQHRIVLQFPPPDLHAFVLCFIYCCSVASSYATSPSTHSCYCAAGNCPAASNGTRCSWTRGSGCGPSASCARHKRSGPSPVGKRRPGVGCGRQTK